jgi:hypothetical protein
MSFPAGFHNIDQFIPCHLYLVVLTITDHCLPFVERFQLRHHCISLYNDRINYQRTKPRDWKHLLGVSAVAVTTAWAPTVTGGGDDDDDDDDDNDHDDHEDDDDGSASEIKT